MIGIFRGDDTNWLGNSPVTVDCSDVGYELAGCKVFMVVQGIASTPVTFPASKIASIVYSSEQTRQMKTGVFFASIKVIDTDERERTLTDTLKVNVTECVSEAYNDITTENVVVFTDDIPYNSLTGKPTINGVTVVNDKTLDDYDMQQRLRVTIASVTSNVATAVDTTPTTGHTTALVTSDGVYQALSGKADTSTTYTKTETDAAIAVETTRATGAETTLTTNLAAEVTRATGVESGLDTRLTTAETNITSLQSGKADKATTLAGYGITDAYTQTETDAAIAVETTRATAAETALGTRLTTAETNITSLQSGKADKATTISGYGITDAYTKTETDAAIAVETTRATTAETALGTRLTTAEGTITTLGTGKADKATTLTGYGITDAYTKTETDAKVDGALTHKQNILIKSLPRTLTCSDSTVGTNYGMTITSVTFDPASGVITAATVKARELTNETTITFPTGETYADGWKATWTLMAGDTKDVYFNAKTGKIYLNTSSSAIYWDGLFSDSYATVDTTPDTDHTNALITSAAVATAVAGKADASTTYTKTETDAAIAVETTRATGAESTLTTNLNTEISRAQTAEGTLTTDLAAEVTRAQTAEGTLTTNLSNEITRATGIESGLATRLTAAEGDIDAIEGKIPSAASTTNQMADKDWVTQAIKDGAATFRGSFDTWTLVPSEASGYTGGEPTKNDYIVVRDASGYGSSYTDTWMFRYTGTSWTASGKSGWTPEYRISTQDLTPAQQAALDSGITAAKVAKIEANETNIATLQTSVSTLDSGKASASAVSNNPWIASTSYAVGTRVLYGTKLYECTTANSDATFDSSKWDEKSLNELKADKATTIAGYGITDAYTKTEIDAKVGVSADTKQNILIAALPRVLTCSNATIGTNYGITVSELERDSTTGYVTSATLLLRELTNVTTAYVPSGTTYENGWVISWTLMAGDVKSLYFDKRTAKVYFNTATSDTYWYGVFGTAYEKVDSAPDSTHTTALVTSAAVATALSGKADSSTTYTKTEVDSAISAEATRATAAEDSLDGRLDVVEPAVTTLQSDVTTIKGKIPSAATSENQLADKSYVDTAIQTATATFRGSFATWTAVPSESSGYTLGTPDKNDYIVVLDASDYSSEKTGTWRFKYSGDWATYGKSGWSPEYQVSASPLTPAQQAAIDSGITATHVTQISTNATNISTNASNIASLQSTKANSDAIAANAWAAGTAYDVGDRVTYAGSFYECSSEHTSTTTFESGYWTKKNVDTVKADKATTLSGYGVTDAYTKTQVDSLLSGVNGKKQNVLVQGLPFAFSCSKSTVAALYTVTLTSITRSDAGILTAATFTLKEGDYTQTFSVPSGTEYADGWIVPWTNVAELTRNLYFNKNTYRIYADSATSDTYWYGFLDKDYQMVDDAPNSSNATRLVTSKGTADAIAAVDAKATTNATNITALQATVATKAETTAVGGTAWAADTEYDVGDRVTHSGKLYECTSEHTSTTTFESGYWTEKHLDDLKADKATTISGYGITDAYTKTEVDAKVAGSQGQKQNLLLTNFPRALTCSNYSFGLNNKITVTAASRDATTGILASATLKLTSYEAVSTKSFPTSSTYDNGWKFTWTLSSGATVNMLFNRTTGRIYYCTGDYTEAAATYYWDGIFTGDYGVVDSTPTTGHSSALVTSGGVYSALALKADAATTYTKTEVNTAIATETTRATNAETALGTRVTTIEGKIPSAATSSNQLADKAYVGTSVTAVDNKISSSASASNKAQSLSEVNALITTASNAITSKMSSAATSTNKLLSDSEIDTLIANAVTPVNNKISTSASSSNPALSDSEVDSLIATASNAITAKMSDDATSSNKLMDKAYVDSEIVRNASVYRGTFDTWALVPSSSSSYTGGEPTNNDFIIVKDASDYTGGGSTTYTGSWRFKYSGVWSTNQRSGWSPECKWASSDVTVNDVEPDDDGNIQIDGSNINVDDDATTTETIKAAIARLESGQVEGGGKFKGEFESYAAIPTDYTQYEGGTAPNAQDYITVEDLSSYTAAGDTESVTVEMYNLVGRKLAVAVTYYDTTGTVKTIPADTVLTVAQNTILIDASVATVTCYRTYPGKWVLFYTGTWATAGKTGWVIKYQLNADRELALRISESMKNIATVTAQANKTVVAVTGIQGMIPPEASSTNHLADKTWVKEEISTSGGSGVGASGGRFLGEFATHADIPTSASGYENEVVPAANDYIVIADASDYYNVTDSELVDINDTVIVGRRLALPVTAGTTVYAAGTVVTQNMVDNLFAASIESVTLCVQYVGKWVKVFSGQWSVVTVSGWKFKYQMNDDGEQSLMLAKSITAEAQLTNIVAKNSDTLIHHNADIAALREYLASGSVGGNGIWAFDTSKTYAVGAFVVYDDKWYVCSRSVTTPGGWTGSTNWTEQDISQYIKALDVRSESNTTDLTNLKSDDVLSVIASGTNPEAEYPTTHAAGTDTSFYGVIIPASSMPTLYNEYVNKISFYNATQITGTTGSGISEGDGVYALVGKLTGTSTAGGSTIRYYVLNYSLLGTYGPVAVNHYDSVAGTNEKTTYDISPIKIEEGSTYIVLFTKTYQTSLTVALSKIPMRSVAVGSEVVTEGINDVRSRVIYPNDSYIPVVRFESDMKVAERAEMLSRIESVRAQIVEPTYSVTATLGTGDEAGILTLSLAKKSSLSISTSSASSNTAKNPIDVQDTTSE